jgi:hypothetical protein
VRLKNLVASNILQITSLEFALWVILQMFKMVPDHFFWILFFAVEKEYLARKDLRQNHHADAARDDAAKRALS